MDYTPAQLARVHYLLRDEWVEEHREQTQENFRRTLGLVESPWELHQYAARFNWDCGHEELKAVIAHPLCDLGTVMMIYFLASPGTLYARVRDGKFLIPGNEETIRFLRDIEERVESGLYGPARISFDPCDFRLGSRTINFIKRYPELIPPHMKEPTSGESVEILSSP